MTYYVYAHTKPDQTVFYVGKGMRGRAWSKHNRNLHWQNTVAKYGHSVVLLADGLTQEQAIEEEAAAIAHFKPFGKLVNILDRGDISPCSNPEVAAKLRGVPRPAEVREKISLKNKGKVTSQETKQKLAAIFKKRPLSEKFKLSWGQHFGAQNPTAKAVYCEYADGTGFVFPTLTCAAKAISCSLGRLSVAAKHRAKFKNMQVIPI